MGKTDLIIGERYWFDENETTNGVLKTIEDGFLIFDQVEKHKPMAMHYRTQFDGTVPFFAGVNVEMFHLVKNNEWKNHNKKSIFRRWFGI